MMGEQVIVLTDLTKQYGNFTAVDVVLTSELPDELRLL